MSTDTAAGITRDDAFTLLKTHIKNEKTIAHCLASEAIMRALALKFDEDKNLWGISGLLHDIDYELVEEDPSQHGLKSREILKNEGCSDLLIDVITKHNAEELGLERESRFEHALTAAESITGLIVATALVYPDKKIASVKPKSITKRMKQTAFARNVSRERVAECEKIGIPIAEFAVIGLEAMKEIAADLGL